MDTCSSEELKYSPRVRMINFKKYFNSKQNKSTRTSAALNTRIIMIFLDLKCIKISYIPHILVAEVYHLVSAAD